MDAFAKAYLFEPFISTKELTAPGSGYMGKSRIVEKRRGKIRLSNWQASSGRSGRTICTVFLSLQTPPNSPAQINLRPDSQIGTDANNKLEL
jgi:hypothetical protein